MKKEEVKRRIQDAVIKRCDYVLQLLNNCFSHISNTMFQNFLPDTDEPQDVIMMPPLKGLEVLLDKFKERRANEAAEF